MTKSGVRVRGGGGAENRKGTQMGESWRAEVERIGMKERCRHDGHLTFLYVPTSGQLRAIITIFDTFSRLSIWGCAFLTDLNKIDILP